MTGADDPNGKIFDELIADGYTLRAFMLQVSVELARNKPNPQNWAKGFISSLHARIDANESAVGDAAGKFPSHEMARRNLDSLGKELLHILQLPPQ